MKAFYKYSALIGFFLFFITKSQAQKIAVPVSSYGVWDRGGGVDDYSDPPCDFQSCSHITQLRCFLCGSYYDSARRVLVPFQRIL